MRKCFIHETARISESQLNNAKIFRNVLVDHSIFGNGCSVGDDSTVERCRFENN